MFLSMVTAMLLNTTDFLFPAPKKSGTASYVQKVYGAVVSNGPMCGL